MPLKTHGLEDPTMNMTPMIDVVFLLIIFFLVGSKFTEQEQQVDVHLPTESVARPVTPLPDPLTITAYADGRLALDGRELSEEEILQELGAARARFEDQAVVVRGDGRGPYQRVIDALQLCHRAGIRHYSLATELKE